MLLIECGGPLPRPCHCCQHRRLSPFSTSCCCSSLSSQTPGRQKKRSTYDGPTILCAVPPPHRSLLFPFPPFHLPLYVWTYFRYNTVLLFSPPPQPQSSPFFVLCLDWPPANVGHAVDMRTRHSSHFYAGEPTLEHLYQILEHHHASGVTA